MKFRKVIVTAHVLVSGPSYDLVEYLKTQAEEVGFLTHPLQPFSGICENVSTWTVYKKGQRCASWRSVTWRLPRWPGAEFVLFAKDFVWTVLWCTFKAPRVDLYIGTNVLNAAAGVVLRALGKARRVVFYAIDFVPDRFSQVWLNRFYHALERFCVRCCDQTWNLSSRMVEARQTRGLPPRFRSRQITVPVGTDAGVTPAPISQVEQQTLVYMGGLLEKQGVHLAIEALPHIRASCPNARLVIIGGGSYEAELRKLVENLQLNGSVSFLGVIPNHRELLKIVSQCALAVAPYPDTPDNFTRYTDPGKPKAYLAAGVPMLITRVPEVSKLIEERGCGLVIEDTPHALAQAALRFFQDDTLWRQARQHAHQVAQELSWEKIFSKALAKVPS